MVGLLRPIKDALQGAMLYLVQCVRLGIWGWASDGCCNLLHNEIYLETMYIYISIMYI
jgi:hypothetical protein